METTDLMLDITAPDQVDIVVSRDNKTLWINIGERCRFRACRIGKLTLEVHDLVEVAD